MPFISFQELIDIAVMAFAIGFIFKDSFRPKIREDVDPVAYYRQTTRFTGIKEAALVAAPAVIFHELAHKFVAMAFGAFAVLHAPYFWYFLAILMRLGNMPFPFIVGGYVSHTALPPLPSAIVAIAGPLTNLLIWALSIACIRFHIIPKKYYPILVPLGKINLFLAIFNMIPIPGFDGANFLRSILMLGR